MDLELVSNEVYLNLVTTELAEATVSIRHGNSGYTVESSDENIATATNEGPGTEITIVRKNEGTAVITVTDALSKTAIDVVVSVVAQLHPHLLGKDRMFDR